MPTIALFTDMAVDLSELKETCREAAIQMEASLWPHYSLEYSNTTFAAYAGLALIACVEEDRDTAHEVFEKVKSVPPDLLYPNYLHLGVYGRL